MASFGSIGVAVNPGVTVGTRKPRMPSWVRAQMTATSAIDARPIHRLTRLITSGCRPGSPPWSCWLGRCRLPAGSAEAAD